MDRLDQYREVADRLNRDIERLALHLVPGGKRFGSTYRVGSKGSLLVHLAGERRGHWHNFQDGVGGDGLDLVREYACSGADTKVAFAWACDWLRLPQSELASLEAAPRRRQKPASVVNRNQDFARRQWRQARPLSHDDPVDRYLRGRGIDLRRLGRAPGALRYHPRLDNSESGQAWPAMLAAITDGTELLAVHRTWLEERGAEVRKAPLLQPKASLGSYAYRGGSIWLWRGQIPGTVLIGEGIEDTLSAAILAPQYAAVCAVSLSGMLRTALPASVTAIVVLAQNDPLRADTRRVLEQVLRRWQSEGRSARFLLPSACYKDLNEQLQHTSVEIELEL